MSHVRRQMVQDKGRHGWKKSFNSIFETSRFVSNRNFGPHPVKPKRRIWRAKGNVDPAFETAQDNLGLQLVEHVGSGLLEVGQCSSSSLSIVDLDGLVLHGPANETSPRNLNFHLENVITGIHEGNGWWSESVRQTLCYDGPMVDFGRFAPLMEEQENASKEFSIGDTEGIESDVAAWAIQWGEDIIEDTVLTGGRISKVSSDMVELGTQPTILLHGELVPRGECFYAEPIAMAEPFSSTVGSEKGSDGKGELG